MSRHLSFLAVGAALCQWLLPSVPQASAAAAEGVTTPSPRDESQTVQRIDRRQRIKRVTIFSPRDASWTERLAAREVRRYIYLRTREWPAIVPEPVAIPARGDAILVARKDRTVLLGLARGASVAAAFQDLAPQGYCLEVLPPGQVPGGPGALLLIIGGDDAGTLYGAYRFAERLGVRFYLHGDVIPDEGQAWQMPALDERAAPLFALRGIQPFHDFPEGPDWWNREDYLAIIGQLPKLRMNFLGLHTYPEDRPCAEPTVWIGLPGDIGQGDEVKFSYPSSYQNTLRGNWGYQAAKTGDYWFGSAALFERDAFGPEVMGDSIPGPTTAQGNNEVFERTGAMLREAFGFAHKLGVKTCMGTETPLIVPKLVQERLKAQGRDPADATVRRELYEGIFRRAAQAYPLDYYWFWTPEGWTWSDVKEEQIAETTGDLAAAIAAYKEVRPPFGLATCGWVLGPQQDRAMFDRVLPKEMAVSCINRQVGYTPVDAGFARVQGRGKWAIPWLEDDPALTSPQLWAGRMRRDAADALRYSCDGLMGIHWRTRVLGPNIGALAQAAWDQSPWLASYKAALPPAQGPRVAGAEGGSVAAFPNNPIEGTTQAPLYQTVRYGLAAYHLPATNGLCKVTLKFCEPFYDAAGKRAFAVKLQGKLVITNLDIFAKVGKNRALDCTFEDVAVTNGWLDIDFVPRIEFPCIAALEVLGSGFATRINCGGPAWGDYAADFGAPEPEPVLPSTKDFYEDWALHQFGAAAGPAAAAIFERIDGKLPKPSTWTDGPGGITPDARPWEQVRKEYDFVEQFAALSFQVRGGGNSERFRYWLNTFSYFRAIGELNCAWAQYNRLFERLKQEPNSAARARLARDEALPARRKLVALVGRIYEYLLATVSTPGELGTVANWNQHNLPGLLLRPGEELARMLGEPLPADAQPGRQYQGPVRIIVPTVRTCLRANEALKLKVIILSQDPPREAALYWRKLDGGLFTRIPLRHLERAVYSVELPAPGEDFEYYIQEEPGRGVPFRFPATGRNQTVVVVPEAEPQTTPSAPTSPPKAYGPTPSERQLRWHAMEFYGFLHFTVNTFTDKEWGDGDEDEKVFNPTAFDADQIAATAQAAGMKGLILTAKHHDGFCLWPSRYTEHSVKNSPWLDGHGDVVREISGACRRQGLRFGVYLSPWDRNHKDYGRPEYVAYYRNQLRELLTNYGDIFTVWFDGANGGSGYYGGARETRRIDARVYYDWDNTRKLVRQLMPGAVMFSDAGPDFRWVGNEDGIAGDPCWATLNAAGRYPGGSSAGLNSGERPGTDWIPPECDVSIRPGWFYHPGEDARVKTPEKLLDIYYKSVGRGACLNLNIPPDRRGQIHEDDRRSLLEFRRTLDATFATNLAQGAELRASNVRGGAKEFAPENALAGDGRAYWATDDGVTTPELALDLRRPVTFNVVSLGEFLPLGQRIEAFALDQWQDGRWVEFAKGTSLGHKRLIRGPFITTDKVRLRITQCPVCPALASFGLFAEPR